MSIGNAVCSKYLVEGLVTAGTKAKNVFFSSVKSHVFGAALSQMLSH